MDAVKKAKQLYIIAIIEIVLALCAFVFVYAAGTDVPKRRIVSGLHEGLTYTISLAEDEECYTVQSEAVLFPSDKFFLKGSEAYIAVDGLPGYLELIVPGYPKEYPKGYVKINTSHLSSAEIYDEVSHLAGLLLDAALTAGDERITGGIKTHLDEEALKEILSYASESISGHKDYVVEADPDSILEALIVMNDCKAAYEAVEAVDSSIGADLEVVLSGDDIGISLKFGDCTLHIGCSENTAQAEVPKTYVTLAELSDAALQSKAVTEDDGSKTPVDDIREVKIEEKKPSENGKKRTQAQTGNAAKQDMTPKDPASEEKTTAAQEITPQASAIEEKPTVEPEPQKELEPVAKPETPVEPGTPDDPYDNDAIPTAIQEVLDRLNIQGDGKY